MSVRGRRCLFETDKLELAKAIQMQQIIEAGLLQWTVKNVGEEMVTEIASDERKRLEDVAAMNRVKKGRHQTQQRGP